MATASVSLRTWSSEAPARAASREPVRHVHKRQIRFRSVCARVHRIHQVERNNRLLALRLTPPQASLSDVSALEAEESWTGAVVYRRDAKQFDFSIVTSLERLALPHLSSPLSRELSRELLSDGIEKNNEYQPSDDDTELLMREDDQRGVNDGDTLVTVDFSVHRAGRDLHLEGEAETVFALQCHR